MKIAVTYENEQIFQHFGHTEQFKIYEVEDGKILSSEVVGTNGNGHGALAGFFQKWMWIFSSVEVSAAVRKARGRCGYQALRSCAGSCDAAVDAFLSGRLDYNPDVKCSHHDESHREGHVCGEHGCGHHNDGDSAMC